MRKATIFIALAFLLVLGATPVYANGIPPLPHAFYGDVTINGSPAPAGTTVEARGEGVLTGIEGNPITITHSGSYGNPGPLEPKLIVQGNIASGAEIEFLVDGIYTGQTHAFQSGETTRLDLAVVMPPAIFSVANLSIQPLEVQPKEAVTITVSVANTGGTEGSYTVVLMIDGVKEGEESVTVAAGSSEIVTFSVTREEIGSYSVAVDGLSASFRVTPEIIGEVVETVPAGQTDYGIDASAEAGTTITVDTIGEVTITVQKYADNPHPEAALPADMLPRYIDISVDNSDAVVWPMYVEQTYIDAEIAGLVESSLGMYYYKAGAWHKCSDTGVNTAANTIWANMTEIELSGSPVAIGGTAAPAPPAPTPGGGGGAPVTPPPPPGVRDVSSLITVNGVFTHRIDIQSADRLAQLTIDRGTQGLTEHRFPLSEISIISMEEPPHDPPEGAVIIGLVYDIGPDGATFSPAITLTIEYDPETLPEGYAEEDLVLAYYDEDAEKWIELDCVVDTENDTITASAEHFTTFAIIGMVKPAAFTVSSLNISPVEVNIDEAVTISLLVTNAGGMSGSYIVTLKINGVKEADKSVTVAAGSSQTVSFSVTKEEAGSYAVSVDGLSGSFTVLAPAVFSLSNLTVQPTEVHPKEAVTIVASVVNTGGTEGSYSVVLKINGVKEAEKTVTIAAGESQDVSFSVIKEEVGSYAASVDGLSGSFTVAAPPVNWPLIGGIIAGVVVVGLLVFFLVRRRKAY